MLVFEISPVSAKSIVVQSSSVFWAVLRRYYKLCRMFFWMNTKALDLVFCSSVRYLLRNRTAGWNTAQELHNSPFLKQIEEFHSRSVSPGTPRMDGFSFCSASLSSIYKVELHYLGTSYFNFCMARLLFSSIFVKKGGNGAEFCWAWPGDVSCLSRKSGKSPIGQVHTFAILLCSCSAGSFVRGNNIREMTLRGKPHIYLVSKLY